MVKVYWNLYICNQEKHKYLIMTVSKYNVYSINEFSSSSFINWWKHILLSINMFFTYNSSKSPCYPKDKMLTLQCGTQNPHSIIWSHALAFLLLPNTPAISQGRQRVLSHILALADPLVWNVHRDPPKLYINLLPPPLTICFNTNTGIPSIKPSSVLAELVIKNNHWSDINKNESHEIWAKALFLL